MVQGENQLPQSCPLISLHVWMHTCNSHNKCIFFKNSETWTWSFLEPMGVCVIPATPGKSKTGATSSRNSGGHMERMHARDEEEEPCCLWFGEETTELLQRTEAGKKGDRRMKDNTFQHGAHQGAGEGVNNPDLCSVHPSGHLYGAPLWTLPLGYSLAALTSHLSSLFTLNVTITVSPVHFC